jgi:hypothetical protein
VAYVLRWLVWILALLGIFYQQVRNFTKFFNDWQLKNIFYSSFTSATSALKQFFTYWLEYFHQLCWFYGAIMSLRPCSSFKSEDCST